MSGLCGIVRFDGQAVSRQDLQRQIKAIAHRGPDRTRIACEGPAGFGALLLRVTHEDRFDDQPLRHDASGILFVSDARIDNREEIAAALAIDAAALADMPDSALLFAAYREWGKACTERLVGDFVFAAYDPRSRTLDLCRDHMGQRHLFFHIGADFLAFASEPKGLRVLPDVPRILPFDQMEMALSLGSSGKRVERSLTPRDGIAAVPGGTQVTVAADGTLAANLYWQPRADPAHEGRDEAYYIDAYRRILTEAVECRVRRTTAPPGIFMSGGFDTGAICALAGPVLKAQGRKFTAVSSVMPKDYQGPIRHARPWVEACRRHMAHLDVHYIERQGLNVFTNMEAGFLSKDAGLSTNRYVNDAIHAALYAAGARVVMDGYGGDYTLNPRGYSFLLTLLRQGRLIRFAREFSARRRFLGCSSAALFRSAIVHRLFLDRARKRLRKRSGLPLTGPTPPISAAFARRAESARAPRNPRARVSERVAMQETLEMLQQASSLGGSLGAAAFGMEFTQPFHDKRIVELGLAIPESLYAKNGRERHLARTALGTLYPPELLARGPANDHATPDFMTMAETILPHALAEVDRMERADKLSKYFDFPRMRQMLTRRDTANPQSGDSRTVQLALKALLWARYIEWFRGDNG